MSPVECNEWRSKVQRVTYLLSLSLFYCSQVCKLPTCLSSTFRSPLLLSLAAEWPSLSCSTSASPSTLFSPLITPMTPINTYFSSSTATWLQPVLTLSVLLLLAVNLTVQKQEDMEGEGLTSSILPWLFFSNLGLLSLPSASCQDARTSCRPSFGKLWPIRKHCQFTDHQR